MSALSHFRIAALSAICGLTQPCLAGGSANISDPFAGLNSAESRMVLAASNAYRDGSFRVYQSDTAGSAVVRGRNGVVAEGYGRSSTTIHSRTQVYSWKKTVERGSAQTSNKNGTASGFSATFLKVQTSDGRFYMYKGYVMSSSSLNGSTASNSGSGYYRAVGGRL